MALLLSLASHGQAAARTSSAIGHAGARSVSTLLKPYTGCNIPGGPDLAQTTPLPEVPMTRAAQTLSGPVKIRIADGVFAAFAYPGSAPFANVKIEALPAASYGHEKADLISEFDKINATGEDTRRNYDLKPTLNGFEIYGFDRTALDGGVLGIYLFFDNAHHVATTAYFLNAPPAQRRFQSVSEYANLREGFLDAYTQCVRKGLGVTAPRPAAKTPARRKARRR